MIRSSRLFRKAKQIHCRCITQITLLLLLLLRHRILRLELLWSGNTLNAWCLVELPKPVGERIIAEVAVVHLALSVQSTSHHAPVPTHRIRSTCCCSSGNCTTRQRPSPHPRRDSSWLSRRRLQRRLSWGLRASSRAVRTSAAGRQRTSWVVRRTSVAAARASRAAGWRR